MSNSNAPENLSLKIDAEAAYAAYDRLPARVRRLLQGAPHNLASADFDRLADQLIARGLDYFEAEDVLCETLARLSEGCVRA